MLRTSVLALAMVAIQAAMANVAPSPPIQASIRTSWAAPPLLLEILYAFKDNMYLMHQITLCEESK